MIRSILLLFLQNIITNTPNFKINYIKQHLSGLSYVENELSDEQLDNSQIHNIQQKEESTLSYLNDLVNDFLSRSELLFRNQDERIQVYIRKMRFSTKTRFDWESTRKHIQNAINESVLPLEQNFLALLSKKIVELYKYTLYAIQPRKEILSNAISRLYEKITETNRSKNALEKTHNEALLDNVSQHSLDDILLEKRLFENNLRNKVFNKLKFSLMKFPELKPPLRDLRHIVTTYSFPILGYKNEHFTFKQVDDLASFLQNTFSASKSVHKKNVEHFQSAFLSIIEKIIEIENASLFSILFKKIAKRNFFHLKRIIQ